MLQVWLLGRPRFRWNGETVELKAPSRAISLLAYLLLRGEQSRAALATAFWGDLPPDRAGKKLRSHLWYLRESGLPEHVADWLVADRRTLRWDPSGPVWIDVHEYERLAADPLTREQALELYAGDFLEGIDDEWVCSRRARLRQRQADMLCLCAERARDDGEPGTAVAYARRALDVDPYREEALLTLMRALDGAGNRASALEAYRAFAQRLRTGLGTEPSAQTAAAHAAIVAGAGIPHGRSPHNLPAGLTSFHGREHEIEALRTYLGERRLVTVVGLAGIGKTRLAVETARGLVQHYADGVWFVDLAPLAQAESIWATIATTLGLGDSDDRAVIEALRNANALLIIDNCEHVAKAVAGVAALITSRSRRSQALDSVSTLFRPLRSSSATRRSNSFRTARPTRSERGLRSRTTSRAEPSFASSNCSTASR
jgi:DNA-binding SARP family transcriptional activator